MKIGLIGAGNLMTNLGKALVAVKENEIVQVWSRTEKSAKALASDLNTSFTTDIENVLESDVYILAVKDSALESLIPPLTRRYLFLLKQITNKHLKSLKH